MDSGDSPRFTSNPTLELLIELGGIHETGYLEFLRASNKSIIDLSNERDPGCTLQAMTQGVDVIYQGRMESFPWRGKADFLIRTDAPSILGNWSYEVADTKLASETRASTIMQLCLYCELLTELQRTLPSLILARSSNPHSSRAPLPSCYRTTILPVPQSQAARISSSPTG